VAATDQAMLADPRRALRVAALLLAGAGLLYVVVWVTASRSVMQWGDDRFGDLMTSLRVTPVVWVAKAFDFLGGTWCTWVLRTAVVALLCWRRHWLHLTAFALAVATSEALIGISKAALDRPRPPGSLIVTSGASFPSGHAVAAAVTAVGVVIAVMPAGHSRWVWERRAALYVSLMAISRAYLGAHWLSDVVAGALLGSGIAIGWPAVLVLWRARVGERRSQASP
jgi:undecaprenyl-diphosphatase